MQIGDIDYQTIDRIATMTLNRPKKYNAITAGSSGNLTQAVTKLVDRINGVPKNQLAMMKKLVNQVYENMGLHSTQTRANQFDGFARHSQEGVEFMSHAEEAGFKQVVAERDSRAAIPGSNGSL